MYLVRLALPSDDFEFFVDFFYDLLIENGRNIDDIAIYCDVAGQFDRIFFCDENGLMLIGS